MSLSEKQISAAHRLGQDVCVVAGPGSGKTSVLIERFCWLVRECAIAPERILAITFTEKAATEIKQRLVTAFLNDYDTRERIERAYVSTIHAFCTRLLKENAIAAGIDPLFEVADDSVSGELRRESADEILEAIYAENPAAMRSFLGSLAVGTTRDGRIPDLADSLIRIYDAMRAAGADIESAALGPTGVDSALSKLQDLIRCIVSERVQTKSPRQLEEHGRFTIWARRILELPPVPTREHFELLNAKPFNKTFLVSGCMLRERRDDINDLVTHVRGEYLSAYYASERELIVEVLKRIHARFHAKKDARSLLDFADLETFAIALLEGDPALCERIRNDFDYILMDELQDTNPLQWRLLDLLRRPDRFFAVGDINQSIFRFRHAEPELFRGYQNAIQKAGNIVDELRDNYRSRGEVLTLVNTVFDGAGPGIVPHKLTGAREFPEKIVPSVELIGGIADEPDAEIAVGARKEALWVAKRIAELAGTLLIGEPGNTRPATFADIAILTRTNAAMTPVKNALEEFGIPSILVGGQTFFRAREINDLILVLRTLVNPCDEIALAGLLRSPFVGLSDESLLRLRQGDSIHRNFARGRFTDFETGDRKALEVFRDQMAELRAMRDSISPDRLLRRLIDASDFESGLSDRGRVNVEKFLGIVRAEFQGSLSELVERLGHLSPEAEAPPSDFGNAVRLMTIHKSKGLEFPIVCLPALHKGSSSFQPIITYAPGIGLGVKWRDPDGWKGAGDAVYGAVLDWQKIRQGEEDDRLLYVAMTRAKEHMLLSYAKAKRAVPKWAEFLCEQLGVSGGVAENRIREHEGLRILITNLPPLVAPVESIVTQENKPVLLNPPLVEEQFDSSASVTSVSLLAACPRKYYLSRYLRWEPRHASGFGFPDDDFPSADLGELDASEFGLQVHAVLAGTAAPEADAGALALAERFHSSALGQQAAQADRVEREFDFVMEVHGMVLRGQIDLWFESAGAVTIVDHKTDQVKLPVEPDRLKAYALQLQIYAMAIQKMTGRLPEAAWLYFLRPDKAIEVDLKPAALAAAGKAVLALRNAQDSGQFPLREGAQCARCEFYRGLCPAGKGLLEGIAFAVNQD